MKRDANLRAKWSIYHLIYAANLACGHELWAVPKKKKKEEISDLKWNEFPLQDDWAYRYRYDKDLRRSL